MPKFAWRQHAIGIARESYTRLKIIITLTVFPFEFLVIIYTFAIHFGIDNRDY